MANWNTDEGRSFRKDRLNRIQPSAAPNMLDERTYRTMYVRPQVVSREEMAEIEEQGNLMFCPACQQSYGPDMVKARRLHVAYGKDPLGNFPMLATMVCKGCTFEEIVAIEVPELTPLESELISRKLRMEMQQSSGMINAPMWSNKIRDTMMQDSVMMGVAKKQAMTFGQRLANDVWQRVSAAQRKKEEARTAEALLPGIEAWEKSEAAKTAQLAAQQRQVAKAQSLGAMYGAQNQLGSGFANALDQYQQALNQQMAQHVDRTMMQGLQSGMVGQYEGINIKELAHEAVKTGDSSLIAKVAEMARQMRGKK